MGKFFGDLLDFMIQPDWDNFSTLISENKLVLASITALLAPKGAFVIALKGLKLGFVALKAAVLTLSAPLLAILIPVAATVGVVAGLVGLFFGLKEALDVIVDDLVEGEFTLGTLGRAALAFLEGLAKC